MPDFSKTDTGGLRNNNYKKKIEPKLIHDVSKGPDPVEDRFLKSLLVDSKVFRCPPSFS